MKWRIAIAGWAAMLALQGSPEPAHEACNAQPACFRITTWGFMDRYTWRQPWDQSLPLPFDTEYTPKPAWQAIQEALQPTVPPPPPPPPSEPPPTPPAADPAGQPAAATSVVEASHPLSLEARLRRQRLRTWLARRALIVLLRVRGAETARVQLVARVRGRAIGSATTDLDAGQRRPVRMSLTGPPAGGCAMPAARTSY